ncbi:bifunctional DNA primase/polymerase [Streptomyces sp. NPDC047082]|uniref:bifunctional DNA primase/polymerase n=1 Tax=Streptomyces sp. NPDC047082 TaxID=3155259 RepID=UPI0033CB1EDA
MLPSRGRGLELRGPLAVAIDPAQVAAWCARQGWPVLPLQPGDKFPRPGCVRCRRGADQYVPHAASECACITQGRWCHSFYAATLDPQRIARWWSERPVPGVGVATGAARLLVIDVDCHTTTGPADPALVLPAFDAAPEDAANVRSGLDTWDLLARVSGAPVPATEVETLTVATPSGGRHLWFRVPRGTRWASSAGGNHAGRSLGWQLDVRAEDAYIVAPGTRTAAGLYEAVGPCRRPTMLPGWLAGALERTGHLLRPPGSKGSPRQRTAPVPNLARQIAFPGAASAWARSVTATALSSVADCVQVAEGSGWSSRLNRAAFTLGGLVASGLVSSDGEAQRALLEAAVHARPQREHEAQRIIQSGLIAGQRRPLNPTKDR